MILILKSEKQSVSKKIGRNSRIQRGSLQKFASRQQVSRLP
jgi:hypothetical protein